MHTFLITLQRKLRDGWPVVAEHNRLGDILPVRTEGLFVIPDELAEAEYDLKTYGKSLGSRIFQDDIRDAFSAARREAGDRLHVLLFIEAEELKPLHWERLCAPLDGDWDFLSLNQRVPFSQYLPSRFDRRYPPIGRTDLRALIVAANPSGLEGYGLTSYNVPAAVNGVRESLGDIQADILAKTEDAVGDPTLDELARRLTAGSYSLLHLICHGTHVAESGETVLYLSDANDKVDKVTGTRFLERLSRLFGTSGLPQVFFLASCESASPSAEKGLGGLAQRLVTDLGTPAVIAMTDKISVATANELSAAFYSRLVDHGEVDLALVEACAALASRHDVTVPALYSRLGGRPIFSDLLEHPLSDAEILTGIDRMEAAFSERAPILKADFSVQAASLRNLLATGTQALSGGKLSELLAGLGELEVLSDQVLEINFGALAKGKPLPPYDPRCPFRGLYPFRTEDLEFFKGRETLVERLLERLDEYPFLAVLGPSGSGKSSLVLAGVLPALIQQRPELLIAYLTPSHDPLAQLEASLAKVNGQPHVLVVDQFEELFTLVADGQQRKAFLDRLLPLSDCCPVILTMRADFWGECAPYLELKSIMQAHQELIAPMDAVELRRAMELQAAVVKLRFESGLSASILDDVVDEPGAMPLLQHALQELWKKRHGSWLRSDEYQNIGGVRQAIAHTADMFYDGLPEDQQELVRGIFMRLTRLDEEVGLGGEKRDTRRRVTLDELSLSRNELQQTKILVNELADARLVVTSLNAVTGQVEIEVAHEALIRAWPRLRGWLEEDRQALLLRDQLRREAVGWQERDQNTSYLLLFGSRLAEFKVLENHPRVKINDLERSYLVACQNNEQMAYFDLFMSFQPPLDEEILKLDIFIGPHARQASTWQGALGVKAKLNIDLGALAGLENDDVAYGQLLSRSFFADPGLHGKYNQALAAAQSQANPLHVYFWIDPSHPDLNNIAWETLQDPQNGQPIFQRKDVLATRAVSSTEVRVRSRRALRALIVTPDPENITEDYDLPAVAVDREVQRARNGLGDIPSDGLPDLAAHALATVDNLFSSLNQSSASILYLTCYVQSMDGDAQIILEDKLGKAQPIPSGELVRRVRELTQKPLLVILAAPQSETGGASGGRMALAPQLVQPGVLSVLALPGGMPEETMKPFTGRFFQEFQKTGNVFQAVAAAWQSMINHPRVWKPALFTCVEDGMLWYIPGFSGERESFEKWPAIFRSIERGQITPILGPGLVEPLLGPKDEMARRWAETYGYPQAPAQKAEFSKVAQFLSVYQYRDFPIDELMENVITDIRSRFGPDLPPELKEVREKIDEVIEATWSSTWSHNSSDPHRLLAQLPLPVFLTANADNLLALALRDAGKDPQVLIFPWNDYLESVESIFDREPNYMPSAERPLVYHLFGRYNEPDSLALTEDDLYEFGVMSVKNRDLWPRAVLRNLSDSALLYLGHQFEDPTFQTIIKSFNLLSGGLRRSRYLHILQIEPEAGQQGMRKRRYQEASMEKRDISVYWGEVQDIVNEIQSRWEQARSA